MTVLKKNLQDFTLSKNDSFKSIITTLKRNFEEHLLELIFQLMNETDSRVSVYLI